MTTASRFRSFGWAAILGGMLLTLSFSSCTRAPDPWKNAKAGQKHILVTFPPLYSLTHAVAGDDGYVVCLLTTDSPHEYQFTATDALKAKGADLLLFNGLELDDRFAARIMARQKVPMLSVGAELPKDMLRPMGDDDDDDHDHDAKEDGHHHHGAYDPHIWLGPPQAMAMVDVIAKKLAEIDPDHADGYKERAVKTKAKLQTLLDEGRDRFKDKQNKKVITMHDSFGYFAQAFGLEVGDTIQPMPGQEPDPVRLGKLIDRCKKDQIRVITYEREGQKAQPEKIEKSLRDKGVDARLTEFDPLEVAPVEAGALNPSPDFYFDKMRANIDNLAKALP